MARCSRTRTPDRSCCDPCLARSTYRVQGSGHAAVWQSIKAMDATLLAKEGYEYSTLYGNLRRLYLYIENNAGTLVNYGMRYHKGLPISSSIAESAVNLVINHRMAKKRLKSSAMCCSDSPARQRSHINAF
ncbi:hypothetical protein BYI23_D015870 (plasmid) [Burkholderia sp. YI23]|nr:hypothetical protein BYI23_D015870 [Burkholderia sp. YI23]